MTRTTNADPVDELWQSVRRPHPKRTDISAYPVVVELQGRYGDMDANGHMNNLALEALHEDVRARMNRIVLPGVYDAGQRALRLVSAQNVVHFLAESSWPSVFHAAGGIGRVGESSFIASSALFIDDRCISTCDTVLVAVDDKGPRPLPDEVRARLQDMLLRLGE